MKLTIETLKKLIKEELNLLESEYGEEFNPQMELPDDHEGEINSYGILSWEDEKNEPFYHSYVDQLIYHDWTLDMIIEAAGEQVRRKVNRGLKVSRFQNLPEDEKWIELYKSAVEQRDGKDIKFHINRSMDLIGYMYKKKKEYFPIPDYLANIKLANILFEKNPKNLNNDILDEAKRMFYFIKDLHQGKLDGYDEEKIDAIKNDEGTFNQAFSGYVGPAPEDSYEGKDIFK